MKSSTLHSLVVARTLIEKAQGLCLSDDRHLATAGLILLQDGLELVFHALLVERGIDEAKNIESLNFDQLIGELKSAGVVVPKSGTLKALNKHRVLAKHYGQLADPITVRGYADATSIALDGILKQVVGTTLNEVFLTELLDKGETRDLLESAAKLITEDKFLEALIQIRKALYVEIEAAYSVYPWRQSVSDDRVTLMTLLLEGFPNKAPLWTRDAKWISDNVKDPVDYIQIDYEALRLDAMEWGINTAELQNLRRLTPSVWRADKQSTWHVKYDVDLQANESTLSNANYCLERTIATILKKQVHTRATRLPKRDRSFDPPPICIGDPVFRKATTESVIVHTIDDRFSYRIENIVTGFNGVEFFYISGWGNEADKYLNRIYGYVMVRKNSEL